MAQIYFKTQNLISLVTILLLFTFASNCLSQGDFEIRMDGLVFPLSDSADVDSPTKGMIIYDSSLCQLMAYDGMDWSHVGQWGREGNNLAYYDGNIAIKTPPGSVSDVLSLSNSTPTTRIAIDNPTQGGHSQIAFRENGSNRAFIEYDNFDAVFKLGTGTLKPLILETDENPRVYISGDGKTGIGTTSPVDLLHLEENQYQEATQFRHVNKAATTTNNKVRFLHRLNTTQQERTAFRLESSFADHDDPSRTSLVHFGAAHNGNFANRFTLKGNKVGLGCDDPDHDLTIGGSGNDCNTGTFSEIDKGEAQFTVSSSRHLKTNFVSVEQSDILSKILAIPVYIYDFKDGPKDKMGLIAEDFHAVFGRGKDSQINGNEVTMALWMAVQELTRQNEEMQNDIEALLNQISIQFDSSK